MGSENCVDERIKDEEDLKETFKEKKTRGKTKRYSLNYEKIYRLGNKMKNKEFNLSEKRKGAGTGYYYEKDIKTFIKILKRELKMYSKNKKLYDLMCSFIDKLIGKKLK